MQYCYSYTIVFYNWHHVWCVNKTGYNQRRLRNIYEELETFPRAPGVGERRTRITFLIVFKMMIYCDSSYLMCIRAYSCLCNLFRTGFEWKGRWTYGITSTASVLHFSCDWRSRDATLWHEIPTHTYQNRRICSIIQVDLQLLSIPLPWQ